jgi:hypothetical protein
VINTALAANETKAETNHGTTKTIDFLVSYQQPNRTSLWHFYGLKSVFWPVKI